ncbi:MAG: phosphogluconate dehydrogenase (NADP(+)-dependent, decarboxylating) [Planctomycetes bacterium]|nr:phosphogluconate dehydrogenase (NADP(+)-dependent, decarboxylating) [Planctomycetota bacterium]
MSEHADFGVIGLGVMGRNLALNVADQGLTVATWNLDGEVTTSFAAEHAAAGVRATSTFEELVGMLARPRRILLMITAGAPVDSVLDQLAPLLEEGDVVVDGGNSLFTDTRRRDVAWRDRGLCFVGMGVSGGSDGARRGPSLMPGGASSAWDALRPVLESIAARTDDGPCVTHVGPDGAGHFVKMVHNGIEYGDMQLLAEAYDVLARGADLDSEALAETFQRWNEGPLQSFLVELTAGIFTVRDGDDMLVERILDRAGQKGTGSWTVQAALEHGVAIPTITAAVDARILSSGKDERVALSSVREGPRTTPGISDAAAFRKDVHAAVWGAKICAYAQGLRLIRAGSQAYEWNIDLAEIARIWKAGCIIRARLLDDIRAAYLERPDLPDLLLDDELGGVVERTQGALRRVVATAAGLGIPTPALSASLSWYDSRRTARLPQNLTQAQRDAFGAHGFRTVDDPDGPLRNGVW